jgi:hypothetical protein
MGYSSLGLNPTLLHYYYFEKKTLRPFVVVTDLTFGGIMQGPVPNGERCHDNSVRGLVVMIVACQVMDPGSIPGERSFYMYQKESFLFVWRAEHVVMKLRVKIGRPVG